MCKETITEIWKPIKNYEGLYEVSNLGRVKSLERTCIGKGGGIYPIKEKVLIQSKTRKETPYYKVSLSKNGIVKDYMVHRLVAETFIDNPNNLPVINHIDCDTSNNCVDNLEWVTQKQNVNHSYKLGHIDTKKAWKQSAEVRKKPVMVTNLQTGEKQIYNSVTEAIENLNLSRQTVYNILNGTSKNPRCGYTFEYTENAN